MAVTPGALLRQTMSIHQHYAHYAIDGLLELGELNDKRAVNARQLVLNLRALGLLDSSVNLAEEDRAWNECLAQYRQDLRAQASELHGRVDGLAKDLEQFCQALEHLQALTLQAMARQLQSPAFIHVLQEKEASQPNTQRADPFYWEIRDECARKLALFDADPRYCHLRDRQFATEHYSGSPIRRILDRWLARQIDYRGNRQKASLLLDMQQRNEERNPKPALSFRLVPEQMAPLLAAVRKHKEIRQARKLVHSLDENIDSIFYDFHSWLSDLEEIASRPIGNGKALFKSLPVSLRYKKLATWKRKVAALADPADPALVTDTLRIVQVLIEQEGERRDCEDDHMVRYCYRVNAYHLYNDLHRLLFNDCSCDLARGCVCKEWSPHRFDASPRYSNKLRFGELAEKFVNNNVSIGTVARLIRQLRQPPEITIAGSPEKNPQDLSMAESGYLDVIPLSEKMGAMGIVDELRRHRAVVDKHLDLPKRRLEIASQIRSHYQANGIAFDDDLIEQGVREFFSQRLVYEAPRLGRFRDRLTRALANRNQRNPKGHTVAPPGRSVSQRGVISRTLGRYKIVLCIIVACTLLTLWDKADDKRRKRDYALYTYNQLTQSFLPGLSKHQEMIDKLEARLEKEPNPMVARLLEERKAHLKFIYDRLPPVGEKEPDDERKLRRMQVLEPITYRLEKTSSRLDRDLTDLEGLMKLGQEIDLFLASEDFKKAAYYFIHVKDKGEELKAYYNGITDPADYSDFDRKPISLLFHLRQDTKEAINVIRQSQAPRL